jgi:KDO2-lipid IV(A) lauroyltransferase
MDSKKIRKSIAYFIGWVSLRSCSLIVRFISAKQIYSYANIVANLGFLLARKQRRIALDSLKTAFGQEKSPAQIKEMARQCFLNMAKSGIEIVFLMNKPDLLRQRVSIENKQYLEAALSEGKGVILVSAHFGNFPVLLTRLSLQGYKVGSIMRPMKDTRVEKFFLSLRGKLNIKTIYSIPRRECVVESMRALRNNELLFIPLDQNFGTAGVFVDFFGRKAATATGPVVLARRTGAKLLPCFIIRQPDDTHKIVFEPALKSATDKTEAASTISSVQEITCIIERYIREYPANWGWIHRRWKSRPKQ